MYFQVLSLHRIGSKRTKNHLTPYHLSNLDPTIIMSTWIPPLDYPCQVCQRINDVDQMLLCNNCNGGYHLFYLKLKLTQILVDIWYCSSCSLATPWFLLRPCHIFLGSGLGGDTSEFHLSLFLCIVYIYIYFFGWLVSAFD